MIQELRGAGVSPPRIYSEALHSKDNPRQTLEEAELAGAQQKQGIKTLN